jgi:hypothetical protein
MKWQADAFSGISYLAIAITAFYSAATEMNSLKEEAFLHKGETVISIPVIFCESNQVFTKGRLASEENVRAGHGSLLYPLFTHLLFNKIPTISMLGSVPLHVYNKYVWLLYIAIQAESNCMIVSTRCSN